MCKRAQQKQKKQELYKQMKMGYKKCKQQNSRRVCVCVSQGINQSDNNKRAEQQSGCPYPNT